ncbi:MAG: hypothetical protein OEY79_03145 [Anaplasmataceae bacterium]|nr:hypothetical protein [Candidatus Heimdallarchaeota archaeon]MDH5796519.1 hypothetical protein [Anaplasmataceae bacterium]
MQKQRNINDNLYNKTTAGTAVTCDSCLAVINGEGEIIGITKQSNDINSIRILHQQDDKNISMPLPMPHGDDGKLPLDESTCVAAFFTSKKR